MSDLTNPHDRFFKETFSHPEIVHDFLRNYLPPEVVAALNLDTLEAQPDSFVDPAASYHSHLDTSRAGGVAGAD